MLGNKDLIYKVLLKPNLATFGLFSRAKDSYCKKMLSRIVCV